MYRLSCCSFTKEKRISKNVSRANTQSFSVYFSVPLRIIHRESNINNIIRVVKHEYDEYISNFEYEYREVPWYWSISSYVYNLILFEYSLLITGVHTHFVNFNYQLMIMARVLNEIIKRFLQLQSKFELKIKISNSNEQWIYNDSNKSNNM